MWISIKNPYLIRYGMQTQVSSITGRDIIALGRFAEDARYTIVFDVLTWDCSAGDKDECVRI